MARILQVCNTDFYLKKFLAPLVRALLARGHDVECVCEGSEIDRELLGGAVVHSLVFPRKNSVALFASVIARMRKLIRDGGYDCVDSHNRNASIVARVAAWLENVPVNLYTAHGFYFHDDQRAAVRWATVGLEGALARVTDFTLSQSSEDIAFMTRHGLILPSRIAAIGNGIDTLKFRPRPGERAALEGALGLASGRYRVAATGRLVKGKGFDDLLDAVARLRQAVPNAELLIIGGNIDQDISPYREAFVERSRSMGMADALVVTGITNRVEDYLATADVFVLPSYREGMPRSLLEAQSMALPVIATDIRGCREVVEDSTSGLLFAPHDVQRLVELLARVHGSPELGKRLGDVARARVLASFDESGYVERQVDAVERLVGKPRGSVRLAGLG